MPVASAGLRMLIQYAVPAVRLTPETGTSFHAPACGAFSRPLASSVVGWPPLSAYRPSTTAELADVAASRTRRCVARPLAAATVR